MKVFDKTTLDEIIPFKKRMTGTERVLYFYIENKIITDKVFNKSTRGTIDLTNFRDITFKNCEFNYVSFNNANFCNFIDCSFKSCIFKNLSDTLIENCVFTKDSYVTSGSIISGNCTFTNCKGLNFNGELRSNTITVSNCNEWDIFTKTIVKKQLERQQYLEEQKELRKNLKYGYKVVKVPVLIKLSFPEDAIVVNLDKDKHRASKAKVESIHMVKDFEGEGVTNYPYFNYAKAKLDYKVGEVIYPDFFGDNVLNCGHGIHFCTNLDNLINNGDVHSMQIKDSFIKLFNEVNNENV